MAGVVLITGASRFPGSRLAATLAADSGVDRVVGIDAVPSDEVPGRVEFADPHTPVTELLAEVGADTVVHAGPVLPRPAGRVLDRTASGGVDVVGTMQLLAACQRSETVRRLVLASTTAVYGSSPRDPAVFTEDLSARAVPRSGPVREAVEVEGYVRGFARRRPDIGVTVLRFANVVGPTADTPLVRYLSRPVVPIRLGYDPRLQLLHEDDAARVLHLAAVDDRPGVFNVAGDGVLLLSQALRRAGRLGMPTTRRPPDDFLLGPVVDTTRLRDEFGYRPRYSTAEAFAAFLAGRGLHPVPPVAAARSLVERLVGAHG